MDQLGIINKALLKCGLPMAAALNDCDWNAAFVFESASHECLRSFAWNFATDFQALKQQGQPSFGFTKAYALPEDCVRVIDVHCAHDLRSPKARYAIRGRSLYAQITPCYLRYITNSIPCEDWPPDFVDVVAARIATEIAPLSAQTMSMTPMLVNLYEVRMKEAQAVDAREGAERVPLDQNILLARAGYENVGRRA